jgi:predicted dehydrogenase
MTKPVAWGVLGVAKIATVKVIPAMQRGALTRIAAIASRDAARAAEAAAALAIPKSYGSYEDLLADPDIEAVYNPLPNHLHVPWTIKALEAGKHVLCEKPVALTADEAKLLIAARDRSGCQVAEAFMVRHHPQWLRARALVREGRIGEVRAIQTFFSYYNDDPGNIRNQAGIGGGALYDIGCYALVTARFLFEAEPVRLIATIDRDPALGVDRLTSGLVEFPGARHLTFTCSTQASPHQRVTVVGTRGRIEIDIPFNADPTAPSRIRIDDGRDLTGGGQVAEAMALCDQYTLQGDAFSRVIRGEAALDFPIEDAIWNLRLIDSLFRSAGSGRWEQP